MVFVGGDGDASATAAIPHAVRVIDKSGEEAAQFGARTSGFVVVYGPDDKLRFSGGITGSRGHAGDNVGRRAVIAALAGGHPPAHPVFGCGLQTPVAEASR